MSHRLCLGGGFEDDRIPGQQPHDDLRVGNRERVVPRRDDAHHPVRDPHDVAHLVQENDVPQGQPPVPEKRLRFPAVEIGCHRRHQHLGGHGIHQGLPVVLRDDLGYPVGVFLDKLCESHDIPDALLQGQGMPEGLSSTRILHGLHHILRRVEGKLGDNLAGRGIRGDRPACRPGRLQGGFHRFNPAALRHTPFNRASNGYTSLRSARILHLSLHGSTS